MAGAGFGKGLKWVTLGLGDFEDSIATCLCVFLTPV